MRKTEKEGRVREGLPLPLPPLLDGVLANADDLVA